MNGQATGPGAEEEEDVGGDAVGARAGPGWRVFRVVFGLLGLGFVLVALWKGWDTAGPSVLPRWTAATVAFGSVLAAMGAGAFGWAALFEGAGSTRRLAHGLFVAHFGKHIPGGIWHVVGQIGLAIGPGVTPARAATAFAVHVVVQVAAGLTAGALFGVAGTGAPGWMRLLALGGLAGLLLLRRPWMVAATARIRRWRGLDGTDHLPSQSAILRCYAWSLATFVLSGIGFALLLGAVGARETITAVGALGGAWVVGFLAVPFPSGIGVREAVMVATLGAGVAPVVAASVLHRLVTVAAETVLALVTWRPR